MRPLDQAHRLAPKLGLAKAHVRMLAMILEGGDYGATVEELRKVFRDGVIKVRVSQLRNALAEFCEVFTLDPDGKLWNPRGDRSTRAVRAVAYVIKPAGRDKILTLAKACQPRPPFEWGLCGQEEVLALTFMQAQPTTWLSAALLRAILATQGSSSTSESVVRVVFGGLKRKLAKHDILFEHRSPNQGGGWRIEETSRLPFAAIAKAVGV